MILRKNLLYYVNPLGIKEGQQGCPSFLFILLSFGIGGTLRRLILLRFSLIIKLGLRTIILDAKHGNIIKLGNIVGKDEDILVHAVYEILRDSVGILIEAVQQSLFTK